MDKTTNKPKDGEDYLNVINRNPFVTLQLQVIEKRESCNQAFKIYHQIPRASNNSRATIFIRSNLISLFDDIDEMYETDNGPDKRQNLYNMVDTKDYKKLREAFRQIKIYLYEKNLTKIDTKRKIDTTRFEEENKFLSV